MRACGVSAGVLVRALMAARHGAGELKLAGHGGVRPFAPAWRQGYKAAAWRGSGKKRRLEGRTERGTSGGGGCSARG